MPLDLQALKPQLKDLLSKGITRLDVALMHSYTYPHHQILVEKLPLKGEEMVNVLFIQLDGGLAPERRFSGHEAVLSALTGGVMGYSQTLFGLETSKPFTGLDMGGTYTDVCQNDRSYEQVLEAQIAEAIIQAPQLDINTMAAAGGLKLKFQYKSFRIGPQSVRSHPGPVCYKK